MNRRSAIKNISIGIGITVSSGTLMSVLSGCKSDTQTNTDTSSSTSFLNVKDANFVEEILDIILPKTDTPGAKDLGIVRYVNVVLKELYEAKDQKVFRKGLGYFQDVVKSKSDSKSTTDRAELTTILDDWIGTKNEDKREEIGALLYTPQNKVAAKDQKRYHIYQFLSNVKRLGISAYFGHKEIGTNHLNYDPVPGAYKGCVPLEEIATNSAL